MASDAKRVEIGFDGGQVVSARLTEKAFAGMKQALDDGGGWHELETEDGPVSLDLAKVVFVRAAGGTHAIGFSGA